MYKFAFSLVIFMLAGGGYAADTAGKAKLGKVIYHHQLQIDTAKVNTRQFDAAAIRRYQQDPGFNYNETKTGLDWWDNFWLWLWHIWDNFWQWVEHQLQKLFGNVKVGKNATTVFKYVIIGIAGFLIVFLILKLIGIDLLKLFRKKHTPAKVPYSEFIEDIHEINFDEAIENALLIKDYRLAVRFLYLRCLKQLSDNNIINWKIEKTNHAYINEIQDSEHRRHFLTVTQQFEYIWYGDFPINEQSYQNINDDFIGFKNRLL